MEDLIKRKISNYVPKGTKLAALLIMDAHRRVLYLVVASTLAELRSRFWIQNG